MKRMNKIIITRAEPDCTHTAGNIARMGVEPVKSPLIDIQGVSRNKTAENSSVADHNALIVTSRNALRFLPPDPAFKNIARVFCVGDATADFARECGFAHVVSADGDRRALTALIHGQYAGQSAPNNRPQRFLRLDYVRDEADRADPLTENLKEKGYGVTRLPVYEIRREPYLSPAATKAITEETVQGIMFYSGLTARAFINCIKNQNLIEFCRNLTAYCISENTRKALSPLTFGQIRVAEKPRADHMFNLLGRPSPYLAGKEADDERIPA